MIKRTFDSENQILAFVRPAVAVSIQVDSTGVTADADNANLKIIPAGTPVGGATKYNDDENAVLSVANSSTAQGVLLHDVNVTAGNANASMLIFGFVNENRIPNVTVSDGAKTALDGKVTFMKRN